MLAIGATDVGRTSSNRSDGYNMNQDPETTAVENTSASDEEQTSGELNRRELLLTAGALGIAALLGSASASAQGAVAAGQGRAAFGPELFSHENLSNFAGLTAKIWADPALAKRYDADPRKVLAEFNVQIPKGVPTPLIPKPPKGGIKNIEGAWQRNDFAAADMLIKEIGSANARAYTTNTQGTVSTQGCPLSTVGSLFCFIAVAPTNGTGSPR